MNSLRALLKELANLQHQRRRDFAAVAAGDYSLDEALHDDIADLLIDNADLLGSLANVSDTLATVLDGYDTANESGEGCDDHDEAIRVAARELVELVGGASTTSASGAYDTGPIYSDLRGAHAHALQAADGDSNDDEIAAWRETAELATALLPGYTEPTITD